MTVVPDLVVTGLLAVVVGLMVVVWSIGFAHRRHGGLVLIGLSVVLLLVGGGIAPPLMGVSLGSVATRIGSTHVARREASHEGSGGCGRGSSPARSWAIWA